MSLREQKYICMLADCGSMTKAAKLLYISQPALSAYINNVENSLGVQLFEREGKKMKLTYAGERYVSAANQMLKLQETMLQEIKDISYGIKGRIRLGMQRRRGPTLVVKIMNRFRTLFPDVKLDVLLNSGEALLPNYENREIDVLIFNKEYNQHGSESELLVNEKILLTASRMDSITKNSVFLPEAGYRWTDITKTMDRDYILPPIGQSLRSDVEDLFKRLDMRPGKIMEISQTDTAMQMAAEGIGLCFTRESYAAQFQYLKHPVFFAIDNPVLVRPLYITYRSELKEHEYFLAFLQITRGVVAESISQRMM